MTADIIVDALLGGHDALRQAMQRATQEFLADERERVFGGGRPDRRKVKDAYDINCGRCEEWAERTREVYRELTGRDEVDIFDPSQMPNNSDDAFCGHVFIRYGGRFYDAECPQGVRDWRKLPPFRNGKSEAA